MIIYTRTKPAFVFECKGLFDFSFFVNNMLTDDGVKFLEFDLIRHSPLVLICGVEVSSPCARHQFNFISHINSPNIARRKLNMKTLATNIC